MKSPKHLRICSIAGLAAFWCAAQTQPGATDLNRATSDAAAYAVWMRPYRETTPYGWFGTEDRSAVKLAVSAIEGDGERFSDQSLASTLGYRVRYGATVSATGTVSNFSIDGLGAKGGCCGHLSEADLRRLDEILNAVPDDLSHL